jgi:hypothetical protein
LHLLQGEAEFVSDLARVLEACYRDTLANLLRHEAGARVMAQYDVNNAYQYTINREETQLSWLARAIADLGGTVPEEQSAAAHPGSRTKPVSWRAMAEEDARQAQAFVDRWSPQADAMIHDRHRKLLRVIIGETLEQKRLFEQALAGRTDLLGRRGEGTDPAVGEVLPTRWIE